MLIIREVSRTSDDNIRQKAGEVVEANLDYLVRFALMRTGDRALAEDIVFEAVHRLLERDLSAIQECSLKMYLFRTVYNLCIDSGTAERTVRRLSEYDEDIPDLRDEEALEQAEIDRLNYLLGVLPEREAEVVRMNVMDGLSFVEISRILYTPASTIKSRFKSGMERLRKQYLNNQ